MTLACLFRVDSFLHAESLACLSTCCRSLNKDVQSDEANWIVAFSISVKALREETFYPQFVRLLPLHPDIFMKTLTDEGAAKLSTEELMNGLKCPPRVALQSSLHTLWSAEHQRKMRAARTALLQRLAKPISCSVNFLRFLFAASVWGFTLVCLRATIEGNSFSEGFFGMRHAAAACLISTGLSGILFGSFLWGLALRLSLQDYRMLLSECVGFWTSWGYSVKHVGRKLQLLVCALGVTFECTYMLYRDEDDKKEQRK